MSTIIETNYLDSSHFTFNVNRLPNVSFFVKSLEIPGVSASMTRVPTPFSTLPLTPDHGDFDPLVVTFFIDEHMNGYKELFAWWIGITFPDRWEQYRQFSSLTKDASGLYSDMSLSILNSGKKEILNINFLNAFPMSISPVSLSYENAETIYATATVTFAYQKFDFI